MPARARILRALLSGIGAGCVLGTLVAPAPAAASFGGLPVAAGAGPALARAPRPSAASPSVPAAAPSVPAAQPPAGSAPDRFPAAAASYLVTLDGRVLWERQPTSPRAPGSLAKIMAAVVLLEGRWDDRVVVTVSPRAAGATGARLGLRAGERVRAGELLTGMLVRSANDACLALAESAAGSVEAFVVAMNARARTMKLAATRFVDPTGLDADGQSSCARDLLVVTEEALRHPEFSRRVSLRAASLRTEGGRAISVKTTNELLGSVPGIFGVKTGYTSRAGKCLVAAAERDGHRVVVVLLDSPDRWWAGAALVEEAFRAASGAR